MTSRQAKRASSRIKIKGTTKVQTIKLDTEEDNTNYYEYWADTFQNEYEDEHGSVKKQFGDDIENIKLSMDQCIDYYVKMIQFWDKRKGPYRKDILCGDNKEVCRDLVVMTSLFSHYEQLRTMGLLAEVLSEIDYRTNKAKINDTMTELYDLCKDNKERPVPSPDEFMYSRKLLSNNFNSLKRQMMADSNVTKDMHDDMIELPYWKYMDYLCNGDY